MNSFGRIFRVHIFGESHGESVGIVIDGVPAGLPIIEDDLLPDLERRKGGKQKGTTPRQEADYPFFKSGIFNGKATGAPITIFFENNNTRSGDYEKQRSFPRPGHADFVAHEKYGGNEDFRGGGHFSARLTTGLVAAGAIAKKMLQHLTPNPSPKERGIRPQPGYMTASPEQWNYLIAYARENRKNQTKAEDIMWQQLRNRNIEDQKFRRQHPIAGYIPDFVCLDKKIIVEIDGEYHNTEEQIKFDSMRMQWLNEFGYSMVKITNDEVQNSLQEVINRIKQAIQERKTVEPVTSEALSFEEGLGEVFQGISIHAEVTEIGGEKDLEKGLQNAIDAKDSVGGLVECRVNGLPIGLGEPFFDSVESNIAHIAFAIPAVKGIEFGSGFAAAKMFGSQHNDAIENMEGKTTTNHAGGIVGGITNSNELVFRIAIKPTASTPKQQNSLNWETGKMEDFSIKGRHDLCVALRAPVILEAATAVALADLMLLEQRIPRIWK
ncbi:chorismate synthase [Panacibacter ginsenosidivorans]|nr:chorismate synthase [Panacibacter ginsenosidivorans]